MCTESLMICKECDRLLALFQRATIDFVCQVHCVRRLAELEDYPYQYEKERQLEKDLETVLNNAIENLNNHRRAHCQA